jgi:hypothetical protein
MLATAPRAAEASSNSTEVLPALRQSILAQPRSDAHPWQFAKIIGFAKGLNPSSPACLPSAIVVVEPAALWDAAAAAGAMVPVRLSVESQLPVPASLLARSARPVASSCAVADPGLP